MPDKRSAIRGNQWLILQSHGQMFTGNDGGCDIGHHDSTFSCCFLRL